jgi:hypothetical protein
MRAPSPEVRKVIPLVAGPGRVLLRAMLEVRGVADDGRVASVRHQVRAEEGLRHALASIPTADAYAETEFGWRESAVALALIEYRDRGGDPERGALIAGQPCPTRLWRPACTAVDELEAAEREAREAQARSEAAVARVHALQASPNKRTCTDRGVIETHVGPGMFPPAWTEGRAPDHTMPDGTRVWIDPEFYGLVAPAAPPYVILQGEDVSPLPYAVATKPTRRATDEDYFRLVRRLAIDTSDRPAWRPLNSATRRMLDDRMAGLLKAPPAIQQHERQIVVRGALVRPDVAARRELDAIREQLLDGARKLQLTMPRQHRDSEEELRASVERQLAGRYESFLADYVRAAGPGYVAFGSCIVTVVDELSDVASELLEGVKRFLGSRAEPVSSEDLAAALNVPADSPALFHAAEAAGWRKVRKSVDGERARMWVPR